MILVTGSHGTIGRRLVKALQAQTALHHPELKRHAVYETDLQHSGGILFTRCDIAEYRQLEALVVDLNLGPDDFVYHLAAEFGRKNGEGFTEQLWKTNVIGTKNLIRLQEQRRFKVIFASSSEVYGELPEGVPYRENVTDYTALVHYNDYAMTKWVNEQQFRNSRALSGTETMILRFFNAYGPGEYFHPYRSVVCLFIHSALDNQPLVVYENYHRAFMYVDDLVSTVSKAWMNFKAGEVYNIGGREYTSVQALAEMVLKATGRSTDLIKLVSQKEHNVTSKRPVIDKAIRDLGHSPKVTLEEGIPLTVAWMKSVRGER
jgi:dTDP-glucose 4,6-dehydratase